MNKILSVLGLTIMMTACQTTTSQTTTPNEQPIGGQTDKHGCLVGAGQTWSVLKNDCVQVFNVADIRLDDPDNDTLAIYVILSDDRQQAEIFGASIEQGTVLTAVKGGFVSQDKTLRLLNTDKGWSLRKQ